MARRKKKFSSRQNQRGYSARQRYGYEDRSTEEVFEKRGKKKVTSRQRRKRMFILFVIEIVVISILLVGVFLMSKFNLMDHVDLDDNKIRNEALSQDTQDLMDDYTDIALFGLDNRETGNYSWGNSDVIMIVSINNKTNELSMVSVYRDTYLDVSAKGQESKFNKANSAFNRGGAEQSVFMLNNNLDLDIDDYVAFDFQAVSDAIDVLGGVEIDITEAEVKYINDYIDSTNDILDKSSRKLSGPGKHTLDGVQAVAYTRIRYTAGGDFKRAERQRTVIAAALNKAKTCDLKTLNKLVDVVFPEIETSMSAATMLQMVGAVMDYDLSQSYGFPFERNAINHPTKSDIVVPCTLETNVIELHKLLYDNDNYKPSKTVQEFSDFIENDTGQHADDGMDDRFTLDYEAE